MKAEFSMTYAERLESYVEIVKSTIPGFFIRWILFMIIGLVSGILLLLEGLKNGLFGNGYWYVLLGALNALMFAIVTYRNTSLKRSYNLQIKDKSDWYYKVEINDGAISVTTEKSESRYDRKDFETMRDMNRYILMKSVYGNSIVLPKKKLEGAFIESVKEFFDQKETPTA